MGKQFNKGAHGEVTDIICILMCTCVCL
jgi:hypothetical protein